MIKNNLILKEINEIMKIDKLAHKEIKWWDLAKKSELIKANKKGLLFVIVDNEKIIGFINYNFRKHFEKNIVKKDTIFLEDIYILPKYRKKAIAKKSIVESVKLLQKKYKISKIKLESPLRLKEFYEKLGFEINHIVMTKMLKTL